MTEGKPPIEFEEKISDLRSVRRGLIIEVLEGEGIEGSPFRHVVYVFDAVSLQFIGRIDAHKNPASVTWIPWQATG